MHRLINLVPKPRLGQGPFGISKISLRLVSDLVSDWSQPRISDWSPDSGFWTPDSGILHLAIEDDKATRCYEYPF